MTTYLYELPTTGAISFGDFCVDTTTSNAWASHIAEATQARANLRGILKEIKHADDKDYLRLIKVRLHRFLIRGSCTHPPLGSR